MFAPSRLTIGLFFPIEAYAGDTPRMEGQEQLIRRAEELGAAAAWFRDVPLRVPGFGDVGQGYEPFVYVASADGFLHQPAVLDGASRFFVHALGDKGRHARTAFSVQRLPLNAPIELAVTFAVFQR